MESPLETGSAIEGSEDGRPHVLIAGGGIAGMETLLALEDLAGERIEITMVAPDPDFTYKPLVVEEPFSSEPVEQRALAPLAEERGARFVQQAISRVDPGARKVELADGSKAEYDALVVCIGARPRAAFRRAITVRADGGPIPIDDLLGSGTEGGRRRIAFVVPPGVSWPLPIYELALMTSRRAEERGIEVDATIVTPESSPLIMFGPIASDAVAELLRARGIEVRGSEHASETEDGEIVLTPDHERLEADGVLALPVLEGPGIAGLPADEHGFIPIDEHARVAGLNAVYAAGDGTTFPIKQGGVGTQQADAAAEHIAARFGTSLEPQPFKPVLRGKLLTGGPSLHLRHDVAGGGGEGKVSEDYLWWPPHKVSGRYLAAWLAEETPHADPEPPRHPIDVEVALPKEWHREPMALDPYESLRVD